MDKESWESSAEEATAEEFPETAPEGEGLQAEGAEESAQAADEAAMGEPLEAAAAEENPLELELESLRAELESQKDKYIRLYADFDNYKKRTAKEKSEIFAYASQPLMEKLLSVLDAFGSALKDSEAVGGPVYEGLVMVSNNLRDILSAEGLTAIAAVGETFDPNKHNGIATDDREDVDEDTVTEEFITGYMYKDRVIRPAMVKVNKKA